MGCFVALGDIGGGKSTAASLLGRCKQSVTRNVATTGNCSGQCLKGLQPVVLLVSVQRDEVSRAKRSCKLPHCSEFCEQGYQNKCVRVNQSPF